MNETVGNPPSVRTKRSSGDRWVKRGFVLVILLAVVIITIVQTRPPKLGWPSDLAAALAAAKAENRRIVVFVHSSPAGADDRRMVKSTLTKSQNRKALADGNYILIEVAMDRNAAWAGKYGVTRTPAMLVIAPDGERFHRAEGFIGEVDFRQVFLRAPLTKGAPSGPAP